jgi:hypothetical protein
MQLHTGRFCACVTHNTSHLRPIGAELLAEWEQFSAPAAVRDRPTAVAR